MKILTTFCLIIILGCQFKNSETIEIMSYYYEHDNVKNYVAPNNYVIIDSNGKYNYIFQDSTEYKFSEQKLSKNVVTEFLRNTLNKPKNFYDVIYNPGGCYFGPFYRIKITDEKNKIITFKFTERMLQNFPEFKPVKQLIEHIEQNRKDESINALTIKYSKQKMQEFMKYTMNLDTLEFPMPPPPPPAPNIDDVKFKN